MAGRPVRRRINLSFYHFHAANYFRDRLAEIEGERGGTTANRLLRHQGYASGAILSAVAFLEASINEFILDADTNRFSPDAFDIASGIALSGLWECVEECSILVKYEIALATAHRELFRKGSAVYDNAKTLVDLRNALVHYKPEWDDSLDKHKSIEKHLKRRFRLNPLVDEFMLFFPTRCLGHGCADWAVRTIQAFIKEFYRRMGTEELLDELESRETF